MLFPKTCIAADVLCVNVYDHQNHSFCIKDRNEYYAVTC